MKLQTSYNYNEKMDKADIENVKKEIFIEEVDFTHQ